MVRSWYKLSLVFRLSPVCSNFKFSEAIQLFGLTTTSHGKPDLKNEFFLHDNRLTTKKRPLPPGARRQSRARHRSSQLGNNGFSTTTYFRPKAAQDFVSP